jgi:riboflavin kinase/FMN adenylyltransferase
MEVWNGIEDRPDDGRARVATIGNFDGLHLGHQRILESALVGARRRGLPSLVVTFEPHPLRVVAPERAPRLVQTRRQKIDGLEALGLEALLILRFDEQLAALDGEAFVTALLDDGKLGLAAVHVGENFRFGRGRGGDLALLKRLGDRHGFEVVGIPPVRVGEQTVSSSLIRDALAAGEVERAWEYLGRPFELSGEVHSGDGRGRRIGFPTANVHPDNEVVPADGVYITEVVRGLAHYASLTNIGVRPTFDGRRRVVESHLLDFEGSLLDERLAVRFLARLREERRFADANELGDQIARDRAAATAYFENQNLQAQ